MSYPGFGVMLAELSGNADSAGSMTADIGQRITSLELSDDELRIWLASGAALVLHDEGQSCCELRYMRTDDTLADFVGSTLLGAEVRDAPEQTGPYGEVHEVQFLVVHTSVGDLTMSSHNEHNGYYGGFAIRARLIGAPS